jgi:hypothetical protein
MLKYVYIAKGDRRTESENSLSYSLKAGATLQFLILERNAITCDFTFIDKSIEWYFEPHVTKWLADFSSIIANYIP